jgi:putative glutamine amidotransferase
MKPRIIIPLALAGTPKESPRMFSRTAYATAIERAGGVPLFLSRPSGPDIGEIAEFMDGLLLMGGVDPHPSLYGEEVLPACGEIDKERDTLELALLQYAIKKNIPVLGLCRGLQVMNVYFGGTLYQDIPTQFPGATHHESHATTERKRLMHSVDVLPDTTLEKILGVGRLEVNSIHHQGIKVLGSGLRASAKSPDGLIEGIEHVTHPFCIGTQWHPEEFDDAPSVGVFRSFIEQARNSTS